MEELERYLVSGGQFAVGELALEGRRHQVGLQAA